MPNYMLHAVLYQEEDWLVARCLEYDIAAQAKSHRDVCYELERILVGHLVVSAERGIEPFDHIPEAPQKYWEMYENALELEAEISPFRLPVDVPGSLPHLELRAV